MCTARPRFRVQISGSSSVSASSLASVPSVVKAPLPVSAPPPLPLKPGKPTGQLPVMLPLAAFAAAPGPSPLQPEPADEPAAPAFSLTREITRAAPQSQARCAASLLDDLLIAAPPPPARPASLPLDLFGPLTVAPQIIPVCSGCADPFAACGPVTSLSTPPPAQPLLQGQDALSTTLASLGLSVACVSEQIGHLSAGNGAPVVASLI